MTQKVRWHIRDFVRWVGDCLRGRALGHRDAVGVFDRRDGAHEIIDRQGDRDVADVQVRFREKGDAARRDAEDAARLRAKALRESDVQEAELERLRNRERALPPVGPTVGLVTLVALSLVTFASNLGIDFGAAAAIPVTPVLQYLIVAGLACLTVGASHLAGKAIAAVTQTDPKAPPRHYRLRLVLACVFVLAPIAVLVMVTVMRGANYEFIDGLVGSGGYDPQAINVGLLGIALLSYMVTVAASAFYEAGRPRRKISKDMDRVKSELAASNDRAEETKRTEESARKTLEMLPEGRADEVDAVLARAKERHARVDTHRAKAASRPLIGRRP